MHVLRQGDFMRDILKKLKNDDRGAAMAVALLVVLVLSLLGAALWQYFMVDTNHVIRDERGMQAYYIARAGADAISKYIMKNPNSLTDTEMETFISNLNSASVINNGSNEVTVENDNVKGKFKITFTKKSDGTYEIVSKGTVKDTSKNVTLNMKPIGVPPTPSNALLASGRDLKWLNGSSHVLNKHEDELIPKPLPVTFYTDDPLDIMKDTTNGNSFFAALSLFFEQDVQIDNRCMITTISNLVVFRGRVILDEKDKKTTGQLVLKVNDADSGNIIDGSTIGRTAGQKYGKVYFMEGAGDTKGGNVAIGSYYFPDGCMLPCYDSKGNEKTGWTYEDAGLVPFSMISGYELVWK